MAIQVTRADLEAWLARAWEFAEPRLLQSAGQLLLGGLAYLLARWSLRRAERHFTAKTASKLDDHLLEVIRRCALISVAVWIGWRLSLIWELPSLARLVVAAWIVLLSLPIADFVAKVLRVVEEEIVPKTETTLDDTALPLLNKVVRALVVAAAVVMALRELDVEIMPFIAGAGVAGVAIGFAAKDTLSNLIAGVLLIMDRPFNVGDRIELWNAPQETGSWGDVIEIGLRATKIRTVDNLIVIIPNNEIMRRDIVNYTASGDHIRIRIPIDIAYDADAALAKRLVLEVAQGTDGVMESPQPRIITRRFGESSIGMELRVWIRDARRRRDIADEITDRVKQAFDRDGIEIPYAKRDLYIRQMPGEDEGPLAAKGGRPAKEERDDV